ncbi:hypothetical protein PENTCL1PPCAC_16679, partial [Pristionchus entomophagus]
RMHLTLAVIGLAAAAVAQEFIPIGGGSGAGSRQGITPGFGEPFTPSIINPSFQPANFAGNRPNPIPLFPKTQQAGTPHAAPVDFTFVHQHSYKEPFRSDQTVTSFVNPIGAARPNIPRTLGRENIYIDPRTDPNSDISKAEAAKKAKNMVFYGLAAPIEKLHSADEFAPSSVPLQNPWDQWYDRFTVAPVDPRSSHYLLTQTKRPTMVDIPFYAADRGKREAETTTEPTGEDAEESTTTVPATTQLSDAIGATTTIAALVTTLSDAAVVTETTTDFASIATTTAPSATSETASTAGETTTATAVNTTAAASTAITPATIAASTAVSASSAKPVNLTAATAAVVVATSLNSDVVTAPTARRLGTQHTSAQLTESKTADTTPSPSTGPSIPFRPHIRRLQTATPKSTAATQKQRALRTKVSLRTTVEVEKTTPAPSTRHSLVPLKVSSVGSAKNSSRAITTKLPLRTTTFQRRPNGRSRVPLRRVFNATSTAAPIAPTKYSGTESAGTSAAVTSPKATTSTAAAATATTPATTLSTLKALNRADTTTAARSKKPFRIFSKRPLIPSKLPARTPIIEERKPAAIDSNNIGMLRTEVNRLLTTVVQLQSTVIAQQQRIALLENQLRLRRASGRKPTNSKTTRFLATDGRERTTMDIRKGRSIQLRNIVAQAKLRQRSSLA